MLRAFGKLSAFIIRHFKALSSRFELTPPLASVRGPSISHQSTCAIDRLQSAACKLFGSLPVICWVQFYLYRGIARNRSSEQKKCAKLHFFQVPSTICRGLQNDDPFSGLSSVGIALQYTDEWTMEPQHESPEDADVRCHEQGIAEPSLLDERSLSIVSSSRSGLSFVHCPQSRTHGDILLPTDKHARSFQHRRQRGLRRSETG